jgi:hypothetical protein
MRRALLGLAMVLLLSGCSTDTYPLPSGSGSSGSSPLAVGDSRPVVVLYLNVRPGDRIELLGAEAVGSLDGATVSWLISRPVIHANGDHVIGESFEDLDGALLTGSTASGADNTVGVAANLTAERPGRYEITDVRLRYRLNGGAEQTGEGISVRWTVCADSPAPATCGDPPSAASSPTFCAGRTWPPYSMGDVPGITAVSTDLATIEITNRTGRTVYYRVSGWQPGQFETCRALGEIEVQGGPIAASGTEVVKVDAGWQQAGIPVTIAFWDRRCGEGCSSEPVAAMTVELSPLEPASS